MALEQQLAEFDLNENQAKTYLALLELGLSSVISLSKKTGIKRTTLYEILEELAKKGLVSQTKKGSRRLLVAENPENLEKTLEEKKNKLKKLMPALKALVNTAGEKPVIRYFEGIEGLKEVYRDTLGYQGELLAFVAENIFDKLGKDFADEYKQKRKKNGVSVRILVPRTPELEKELATAKQDLRNFRFVSAEKFPFSVEMNLYGNKIAFMSFSEQLGLIVESNEIAKNMRFLFELAWIGAKATDIEEKRKKIEDEYWA